MESKIDNRDDATPVALVLAGEHELFGTLLLRYYPSVVRLCQRLLGPTLEAQDVAQEAALQAFLGLAGLRDPARFGAWLHAIAANLARMALRRRRILSLDALSDGAPLALLSAADAPTPEEVHAAREIHDAIVAALNELSAVNREAMIGFYMEGYSYVELAELLGVPVSTVKGRLFKGRQQLRRALAPIAHEVLKPDRRPRKELVMEPPELVEVKIEAIRTSWHQRPSWHQHRVVILREEGTNQVLPIWIGHFEADAIELSLKKGGLAVDALTGKEIQLRPMTHDLALRLLETLGAQVQRVVVNKLVENTFYAEITLAQGEQVYQVDARPSDALALAVRTGAPVYVARTVLNTAGADLDDEQFDLLAQADSIAGRDPQQCPLAFKVEWPDWPDKLPTREIEWEGLTMLAVQLPSPAESEWLLVRPALWEKVTALARRIREMEERCTREPTSGGEGTAEAQKPEGE